MIEREFKFLAVKKNPELWARMNYWLFNIVQAYLLIHPDMEIRIRREERVCTKEMFYTITTKVKTSVDSERVEITKPLSKEEFDSLYNSSAVISEIQKTAQ